MPTHFPIQLETIDPIALISPNWGNNKHIVIGHLCIAYPFLIIEFTVASKLLNFAPTLSNLNVSEYLSNSQTCQCKKSKFCYEPHGHVITGDLRVIENAKLRELVAKGPKYREPNRVNWKATETMFLESIDLYAKIGPKENK